MSALTIHRWLALGILASSGVLGGLLFLALRRIRALERRLETVAALQARESEQRMRQLGQLVTTDFLVRFVAQLAGLPAPTGADDGASAAGGRASGSDESGARVAPPRSAVARRTGPRLNHYGELEE